MPEAARVTVRPYTDSDFEEAVSMWSASKRAAFSYVEAQQRHTLEDDARYFGSVIARDFSVWLALVERRIAGLLAIKGDFVDQLFVHIDLQRIGVGTALLCKAQELSPAGLHLHTFEKNLPARRFYQKHGFRPERFGVSPPPENEPDVAYRWGPPVRA